MAPEAALLRNGDAARPRIWAAPTDAATPALGVGGDICCVDGVSRRRYGV